MLWLSLGLLAAFLFGVLTPVLASMSHTVDRLSVQMRIPVRETATPYGVCADVCTLEGACRHIVVPGGWHRGDRVADARVLEAAPCH